MKRKLKTIVYIIIAIFVIMFFALFIIMILSNEDFDTYINETKDVSIELEGNAYIINTVEPQLLKIAKEYLDNPYISYVEYKYRNENDIKAMFFCRSEYTDGKYHDSLMVNIDAVNNKVYSVQYQYSNTKNAASYSTAYLKKDIDIKKHLNDIVEESDFQNYKNSYIKFYFYFDEIYSLIEDNNGHVIWRSFETTPYRNIEGGYGF